MLEHFVLPTGYPPLRKERYHCQDVMGEAMSRIGCVEILPAERERASEIKWSSYLARTALRLGEEGKYIFDPDKQLQIEEIRNNPNFLYFKYDISLALNGGSIDFSHSLPDSDPVFVNGIIRRIIAHPSYRRILEGALKTSSENLFWLMAVIDREQKKAHEQTGEKPAILVVAHKFNAQTTAVIEKVVGERLAKGQTVKRISQFLGDLSNGILSFASTPYMGAATVLAEAEETGSIGKVEIVDYNEVLTSKPDDFLEKGKPKYAFITGAVAFDAKNLPRIVDKFSKGGTRCLIGGITATIDPEVMIQTSGADIFIGESEGAMNSVLEIYRQAEENERFIFHRGVPARLHGELKASEKKYLIKENAKGYFDVFLDVPPFVRIEESYSPEKEASGFLSRRLKYQEMMDSPINLFGRQWEKSIYSAKQMETSRFCPWRCRMCSTVRATGQKPRRMPIESLGLLMNALETEYILVNDQNFGAIGKDEPWTNWESWMLDFLTMMNRFHKTMACQAELAFFGRLTNPYLKSLVEQTVFAVLSGLESPAQLKGTKAKDYKNFARLIKIPKQMKIVVWGTAITGLPDNYFLRSGCPDDSSWKVWLSEIKPDILIVFPHVAIPGSLGVSSTLPESDNPFRAYEKFTIGNKMEEANQLNKWYVSLKKIMERQMGIKDYHFNRKFFVLLSNLSIWAIYQLNLDEFTVTKMAYPGI